MKIKSPGSETAAKTAARLRLESYAEAEPLPRLLGNSRTVTKRADQRADKVISDGLDGEDFFIAFPTISDENKMKVNYCGMVRTYTLANL